MPRVLLNRIIPRDLQLARASRSRRPGAPAGADQ